MQYRVLPEYQDRWTDASGVIIVDDEEIDRLAAEWECDREELMSQVEEVSANVEDTAAALIGGGWMPEDRDQLQTEYELTDDEVDAIITEMRKRILYWWLVDDCTSKKANMWVDKLNASTKGEALELAGQAWDRKSEYDQQRTDHFYIALAPEAEDGDIDFEWMNDSVDIK